MISRRPQLVYRGIAPVAQWIRRLPTEQEILGSIPGGGTFLFLFPEGNEGEGKQGWNLVGCTHSPRPSNNDGFFFVRILLNQFLFIHIN
jgi:hypothetical protein